MLFVIYCLRILCPRRGVTWVSDSSDAFVSRSHKLYLVMFLKESKFIRPHTLALAQRLRGYFVTWRVVCYGNMFTWRAGWLCHPLYAHWVSILYLHDNPLPASTRSMDIILPWDGTAIRETCRMYHTISIELFLHWMNDFLRMFFFARSSPCYAGGSYVFTLFILFPNYDHHKMDFIIAFLTNERQDKAARAVEENSILEWAISLDDHSNSWPNKLYDHYLGNHFEFISCGLLSLRISMQP